MKLTASGLLNDSDTVCVDTSGQALTATYATSANTAASLIVDNSTKLIIKSSNANNRTTTITAPYTYMPVIDGLNTSINFKLNYTVVLTNQLYFRTEIMFMGTNSVGDHTFILSLKESNRMNDLQGSYDPPAGKWFSALTFNDSTTTTDALRYDVCSFSDLSVNTFYAVDKRFTGLYISASQNIINLESTQTAEILIWPRCYIGDVNLTP